MWEVQNRTQFEAAGAPLRDRRGREHWCVSVRASFDLQSGKVLTPSEEQTPVYTAPEYLGDDAPELVWDSDMCPFLPGAELTLHGLIRAPERAADSVPLQVSLGKHTKQARLYGPRHASRGWVGWKAVESGPVEDTELLWAHSFGGETRQGNDVLRIDRNPSGTGAGLLGDDDGPVTLPRIDHAESPLPQAARKAQPIGFSPLAPNWSDRLRYAGTYDAAWEERRAPVLPTDFDPRHYFSAPPDQIFPDGLKGGETLRLDGFVPDEPVELRLPQVLLEGRTRLRRQQIESDFTLKRVTVDLTKGQVGMVWTMHVDCNGDDLGVDSTQVLLRQMTGVAT